MSPSNADSRVVAVLARYRWGTAATQAAVVVAVVQAWAVFGLPGPVPVFAAIGAVLAFVPFWYPIARSAPVAGRRRRRRLAELRARVEAFPPIWTDTLEGHQARMALRDVANRTGRNHGVDLVPLAEAYQLFGLASMAATSELSNHKPGWATHERAPGELTNVCVELRAIAADAGADLGNDPRWERL